jgi:hypothetical protein
MAQSIPFPWKGDTWYSMKFQATNKSGQAFLRAKVWRKGEPEPEKWTLEASDPVPNTHGAPGLYGNATDGEIYLDNISVTPNQS